MAFSQRRRKTLRNPGDARKSQATYRQSMVALMSFDASLYQDLFVPTI